MNQPSTALTNNLLIMKLSDHLKPINFRVIWNVWAFWKHHRWRKWFSDGKKAHLGKKALKSQATFTSALWFFLKTKAKSRCRCLRRDFLALSESWEDKLLWTLLLILPGGLKLLLPWHWATRWRPQQDHIYLSSDLNGLISPANN